MRSSIAWMRERPHGTWCTCRRIPFGEIHKEAGNLHHTGVGTHDHKTAGADDGTHLLGGIKVQRQVKMLLRQATAGGTTDLDSLELSVLHAAADIKNDLAQRCAHGDLNKSRVLNVAGERKGLGAGVALSTNALEPVRAFVYNDRYIGIGLDIIEYGGLVEQALINGSGGFVRGMPRLPSMDVVRAEPSPQTNAPAPMEICR